MKKKPENIIESLYPLDDAYLLPKKHDENRESGGNINKGFVSIDMGNVLRKWIHLFLWFLFLLGIALVIFWLFKTSDWKNYALPKWGQNGTKQSHEGNSRIGADNNNAPIVPSPNDEEPSAKNSTLPANPEDQDEGLAPQLNKYILITPIDAPPSNAVPVGDINNDGKTEYISPQESNLTPIIDMGTWLNNDIVLRLPKPNYEYDCKGYPSNWWHEAMKFSDSIQGNGEGVRIVIIDTGVNESDPDIQKLIYSTEKSGVQIVESDHATQVARTIGIFAPLAEIISIDASVDGLTINSSSLVYALAKALDLNSDVVVMSFSGEEHSPLEIELMDKLIAKGTFIVAAAGNESSYALGRFPSGIKGVITAGAIDNKGVAKFSNFGTAVDVYMPGVCILPKNSLSNLPPFTGTSASAPMLAGILANLLDTPFIQDESKFLEPYRESNIQLLNLKRLLGDKEEERANNTNTENNLEALIQMVNTGFEDEQNQQNQFPYLSDEQVKQYTDKKKFSLLHKDQILQESLGIEVNNTSMHTLISKDTQIPASAIGIYRTRTPQQQMMIFKIYAGENDKTKENRYVGEVTLENMPPEKQMGERVRVVFNLSEDGNITINASDILHPEIKLHTQFSYQPSTIERKSEDINVLYEIYKLDEQIEKCDKNIEGVEEAIVGRIIDGDTLETTTGSKIRFLGINTPEMSEGRDGEYAKEILEKLLPPETSVCLKRDTRQGNTDIYGRLLRYVHKKETGIDIGLIMLGAGLAEVYDRFDCDRCAQYQTLGTGFFYEGEKYN